MDTTTIRLAYAAARGLFASLPADPFAADGIAEYTAPPEGASRQGGDGAAGVWLTFTSQTPVRALEGGADEGMCEVTIPSSSQHRLRVLTALSRIEGGGLTAEDWHHLAYGAGAAAERQAQHGGRAYGFTALEGAGRVYGLNLHRIGEPQIHALQQLAAAVEAWPEMPPVARFPAPRTLPAGAVEEARRRSAQAVTLEDAPEGCE